MRTSKLRVGIVGASGYGGAEMARLLLNHNHAELTVATASGERTGAKLSDLFPSLRGLCDLECEPFDADNVAEKCDFAFLALGHGKALELAAPLLERDLKVCDFGADFRLRDAETYAQWYKLPHTQPRVLADAIYGLPEWNREEIRGAKLVANPGCYPTSAILALAPFVEAGLVDETSLIVDAASGTSGGGRSSFGVGMHAPEVHGDFKAYNVASHRHTPEIEQGLTDAAGAGSRIVPNLRVTFTAHLLPIARGILATCYATLRAPLSTDDALRVLAKRYENEPFVRLHESGSMPQIKHVVGSNFCDIGAIVDARTGRLVVVSAIDNLVKGAAGQALQNMNLMNTFPEDDGLKTAALFP